MKQKDLFYLLLAAGIFVGAGFLAYTQLMPKKAGSNTVQVEKVGIIPDKFDETALTQLEDGSQVVNYSSPEDLGGLNNTAPFGP